MEVDSEFALGEEINFTEVDTIGSFGIDYEHAAKWKEGPNAQLPFDNPLCYAIEEFTLRIDGKDKGRAVHLCIDGFKVLSIDVLEMIVANEGFDSIGSFVQYFTVKHGDKSGVVNVKGKLVHWTDKVYNPTAKTLEVKSEL